MFLAIKEIKKNKIRFLLVVGIIMLISYLVFFLTGLAYGLAKANTSAIENWDAKKIVMKAGTNANLSASIIELSDLSDFDGEKISPINLARTIAYRNGGDKEEDKLNVVLMGIDRKSHAYPKIIQGKAPNNSSEVVASISMNVENNLKLGDHLMIINNGRKFKVVGFTKDAKYSVSPVVYTDLKESSAAAMSFVPKEDQEKSVQDKNVRYQTEPDSNSTTGEKSAITGATESIPDRVAGILVHGDTKISSDEKYDVLNIDDYIKELPGYTAQILTFGLMIGFLILISSIVLGVFMYIITMQKMQIFGVMKVQGISNVYIGASVVLQTFLVSIIGILIGLILTVASEIVLPVTVPFKSNYVFYSGIAIMMTIISLLGSIFSVKGISKIDPLEVLE